MQPFPISDGVPLCPERKQDLSEQMKAHPSVGAKSYALRLPLLFLNDVQIFQRVLKETPPIL